MCNTPAIFCRFSKKDGVAKKRQWPFSAEWDTCRPFLFLRLKKRFFDDPGVKGSSKAQDKKNNQPQQQNPASILQISHAEYESWKVDASESRNPFLADVGMQYVCTDPAQVVFYIDLSGGPHELSGLKRKFKSYCRPG